jgi:hypothetical protein
LCPVIHGEFPQQVLDVFFHGLDADLKRAGDLIVGQSESDVAEDLFLPGRNTCVAGGPSIPSGHRSGDLGEWSRSIGGLPCGGFLNGRDEFLLADAFEQEVRGPTACARAM